jgi:hypothetical protein
MYKYVVFDLDETLGYFTQLGIFWESLLIVCNKTLTQTVFNELCELFPRVFRPGIFSILSYLKHMKHKNNINKIIIYTNNQGPKKWTKMIKNYIEYKLHTNHLFDQIIGAFKVRGKIIESCRTTHEKTIQDLVKCTNAPRNSTFIFMDDQYHAKMRSNIVNYINVKPYEYHLSYEKMMNTVIDSNIWNTLFINKDKVLFKNNLMIEINKYRFNVIAKSEDEFLVDKAVTKKMMIHLQDYFNEYKPRNTTRKRRKHNAFNRSRKQF